MTRYSTKAEQNGATSQFEVKLAVWTTIITDREAAIKIYAK